MHDSSFTSELRTAMPFAELIRIEVLERAAERVRARVAWDASLCTSGGVLHGGLLMALADSCGGLCAFLNLPEGARGTATIESKTNFLRGVGDGGVTATAQPLHSGRLTVVVETELTDDDGRLVAKTTQTQAVLRPSAG